MSLVKICGLTRDIDIEYANMLKPDFIGFVFAESSRKVTKSKAFELKRRLDPSVKSVGVFVNADHSEIIKLCQEGVIDMIQLHGDEDDDYIRIVKTCVQNPIIKSFRIVSTSVTRERTELNSVLGKSDRTELSSAPWKSVGAELSSTLWKSEHTKLNSAEGISERTDLSSATNADFLLFDAFHNGQRGGSGVTFDWTLIKDVEKPFFLAGGLNITNVDEALLLLNPYAVDVSSGVETGGYKDYNKMSLFINKVRQRR